MIPLIGRIDRSICYVEETKNTSCNVSVRLQATSCLKILCIELKLQSWSLVSVQWPVMVLKNIDDATIMSACRSGDITVVRNLLDAGEASVYDVTRDNDTPLSVSELNPTLGSTLRHCRLQLTSS